MKKPFITQAERYTMTEDCMEAETLRLKIEWKRFLRKLEKSKIGIIFNKLNQIKMKKIMFLAMILLVGCQPMQDPDKTLYNVGQTDHSFKWDWVNQKITVGFEKGYIDTMPINNRMLFVTFDNIEGKIQPCKFRVSVDLSRHGIIDTLSIRAGNKTVKYSLMQFKTKWDGEKKKIFITTKSNTKGLEIMREIAKTDFVMISLYSKGEIVSQRILTSEQLDQIKKLYKFKKFTENGQFK